VIIIKEVDICTYGASIEIESHDKITNNDKFKIELNGKNYYFAVSRLKCYDYDEFTVNATLNQVGFKDHINKEPDLDIRDFMRVDLIKVEDEKELEQIFKKGEN